MTAMQNEGRTNMADVTITAVPTQQPESHT